MTDDVIQVVYQFPRAVREIENTWIPLADGMIRLTRFGWEHGSVSRHYYTIRDGDPNSACLRTHWTTRCKRPDGDLDVRIETHAELRSTPAAFLFGARLEAYEGKERVYEKDWEQRFARHLN